MTCGIVFVLLAIIVIITVADDNANWSTAFLGAARLCIGAVAIGDIRQFRRE